MPGLSGLDLQKELARRHIPLPVIIITAHGDTPMAVGALKSGACDFVEKPYDDQHLIDSVRHAIDRGARMWNDHERIAKARADYESLTAREREVMALVVAGESSKVIAGHLGISPRTVEIHRARIMEKVHARGLTDLKNIDKYEGEQEYMSLTIDLIQYFRSLSRKEFASIAVIFQKEEMNQKDADYINKVIADYNANIRNLVLNWNLANQMMWQEDIN